MTTTETRNDVDVLAQSFRLSLHARNRSPRTVQSYNEAVTMLSAFLEAQGMPTAVAHIHREHVEAFIADLLACFKPSTASNRFKSLQQFFKWLVEDGEISSSPMQHMEPPSLPESLTPVMAEAQIVALLKSAAGKDFDAVRDTAILRLMLDSGMRLAELAGIKSDDLDLIAGVVLVTGKGNRQRACPFGRKTAAALDKYRRAREKRADRYLPAFWLGLKGPLRANGIYQMVKKRGAAAGLDIHPHSFRHAAANGWLASGAGETDLMTLMGWRSRSMLSRYAAAAAASRAIEAHHKLGLMDRL